MHTKRSLIIPDPHIPFEDKRAYDLMLSIGVDAGIDEVVILGDFADFYGVSQWDKNPGIKCPLEDERILVCKRLKELKNLFPNAKRVYLGGNHEHRFARYIQKKAPELFGVVNIEEILALNLYEFDYLPYSPYQKYNVLGSPLIARHDPMTGGLHCAHGTVVKAGCSVIFGHTHRIQQSQVVALNGEIHRGISTGWLGDKTHEVMGYVKTHHQWSLGFSIVTVLKNGAWLNSLIHIVERFGKYYAQFDGHLYVN